MLSLSEDKRNFDGMQTIPLSNLAKGRRVKLVAVNSGRKLKSHLYSLGLRPGATIEVIGKCGNGPLILRINDSKIMLGKGMARKIMVG